MSLAALVAVAGLLASVTYSRVVATNLQVCLARPEGVALIGENKTVLALYAWGSG